MKLKDHRWVSWPTINNKILMSSCFSQTLDGTDYKPRENKRKTRHSALKKAWKASNNLNSHSTSIYPFSLHTMNLRKRQPFFFLAQDNFGKVRETAGNNMIDIVEYFQKDDMCLHSHCAVLVAVGSGWITQVRSLRGQLDFQEKVPPTTTPPPPKTHGETEALNGITSLIPATYYW